MSAKKMLPATKATEKRSRAISALATGLVADDYAATHKIIDERLSKMLGIASRRFEVVASGLRFLSRYPDELYHLKRPLDKVDMLMGERLKEVHGFLKSACLALRELDDFATLVALLELSDELGLGDNEDGTSRK